RRDVGIRRRRRERDRHAHRSRLVSDRRENRRHVHLIHGDRDRLEVGHGRAPVVRHANRDREATRALRLRRRPAKRARRPADRGTRRGTRIQRERQHVSRVRIRRRRREGQRRQLVHRLVAAPTVIEIASKALNAGVPLSVTRTVTGNVPAAEGVQLKAPVEPLIVAPAGAPASSEKVKVFAGTSASVAVAVKVTATPTVPDLLPIAANTGATFTSVTVIVIAVLPLNAGVPLSVAVIVTGYVPGPCASVGVQLKAPVPAPIVAPVAAGVPSVNDHAIVFAGTSASVAVTVKARFASSAV